MRSKINPEILIEANLFMQILLLEIIYREEEDLPVGVAKIFEKYDSEPFYPMDSMEFIFTNYRIPKKFKNFLELDSEDLVSDTERRLWRIKWNKWVGGRKRFLKIDIPKM